MLSRAAGLLLIAGGAGLAYYLYRQYSPGQAGQISAVVADTRVTTVPPEPLSRGTVQPITATVSWRNPSNQPVTYGVQGAVIQAPPLGDPDLVGGHWWSSPAALQQAVLAYGGGGTQSQVAAAAALAAMPAGRVVTLQVGPGQQGSVQLFGSPQIVVDEQWWFWIVPNPPANRLLVADPVRTHISALPAGIAHKVRVV